jgi:hypothetical protein
MKKASLKIYCLAVLISFSTLAFSQSAFAEQGTSEAVVRIVLKDTQAIETNTMDTSKPDNNEFGEQTVLANEQTRTTGGMITFYKKDSMLPQLGTISSDFWVVMGVTCLTIILILFKRRKRNFADKCN